MQQGNDGLPKKFLQERRNSLKTGRFAAFAIA
jgi:hypothetical protein